MLTPAQEVSKVMAAALQRKLNLTFNPDTTYIVTTNYDLDKPKPRYGKVLNKISLTDAALANKRGLNRNDETPSPKSYLESSLPEIKRLDLTHGIGGLFLYDRMRQVIYPDPAYEYIVRGDNSITPPAPDLSSKVPLTPQAFRDLIWNTERLAPYKKYLDNYWSAHEHTYKQLSKIALAQAAYTQTQEGSLSEQDARLVMRAAGLPPGKPWPQTSVKNLETAYAKDPTLEVGLLTINGNNSTDLMYIIDKNIRLDANGKAVKTTLLHIPGNSSPLHRFDSPEEMKNWLADQASDPTKRAALLTHFKKNDQDNKFFSDGVEQSLKGLGGWTESQKPNRLGFTGFNAWDPQRFITLAPVSGDPFKTITQHHKERSYADADHDITTDSDVIKTTAINVAGAATAAALMMTPLAFVMPEVGLALDAIYIGAGLTQASIGIDDLAHGKSSGTDRVIFGVLNAMPAIASGVSKFDRAVEAAQTKIPPRVHPIELDEFNPTAGRAGRLPPHATSHPSATQKLTDAIEKINKDENLFNETVREQVAGELTRLAQSSKAESFQSLTEYTEAGSDEINNTLRTQVDPSQYPPNVKEFLSDLAEQADYDGKGYRYAFVTSEGANKLKNGVGAVFRDAGVQSASSQPFNAKDWGVWAEGTIATRDKQAVIYVFDESIPKKNLSTGILLDHIAVEPDTSLEVRATQEQNGILYVYFDSPTEVPEQRYNLFDGSRARPF